MTVTDELADSQHVPLRHLVSFNPRPRVLGAETSCYLPMEAISEFGDIDTSRQRPTSELQQGYSYLEDGDVAYAKVTPCFENGKGLLARALPNGRAFATTEVTVLRPSRQLSARYLSWVLQSDGFRSPGEAQMSGAGGLKRVPESYTAGYKIALLGLDRQRAIADYLDRETTQIDAFIAKNEELVSLLIGRRSAVARAIVEPHVGEGTRVKHHFREVDNRAGGMWAELPLLSVSIHDGVTFRAQTSSAMAHDMSHYKVAQTGDIVLNRMRAFQGGLGVAPCAGLVSPDYAILRPMAHVDPNWMTFVMRTPLFVGEMARRLRGIGSTDSGAVRTPRISVKELGDIRVTVPAPEKQQREVESVSISTSRIAGAIASAQRGVELARERRAALIAAAVTGKIDVGGRP